MECMEAKALKSSFCSETAAKNLNQQGIPDDIWCLTGLPGDDFIVDDFFDLSNEENMNTLHNDNNNNNNDNCNLFSENNCEEHDGEKDSNSCGSLSSSQGPVVAEDSAHFAIPDDDMQELELWSHLMDDSVPEQILTYPKPITETYNKNTGFTFVNRVDPFKNKNRINRVSLFPTAVPVKPRTKRPRSFVTRSWFTGSPPKTESSSSSSSPSSPVSTLLFAPLVRESGVFFMYAKPPLKKPKKKTSSLEGEAGVSSLAQRKCSHCQVTKTPQWRAGPNGPKTLCNACGVRYKSGRLFPEYRPACSPTFSSEEHSNSHRKVLEMRRQKEMTELNSSS